jgi:hypothetical protein
VNFKNYFERWLAEAGITYRTWVSQHRRDQIWVRLGLEFRKGFFLFFPTNNWSNAVNVIWSHDRC